MFSITATNSAVVVRRQLEILLTQMDRTGFGQGSSSSSLLIPGLESSALFLRCLLAVEFRYLISSIVLVFFFGWRNTILFLWQLFKMSVTSCLIYQLIVVSFSVLFHPFYPLLCFVGSIFSYVLCAFLHFLIIVCLYPSWVLYIFFFLPSVVQSYLWILECSTVPF